MFEKGIIIKIILLGDGRVGKTSLKSTYLGKGFQERYLPTLGAEISIKKMEIQNLPIVCNIWDLAGQPKFNRIRGPYYVGATAAILVYDITHSSTLYNLKEWIKEMQKRVRIESIPLLIIGNKIDLRETASTQVTTEEGQTFVETLKNELKGNKSIYFLETSAKTTINVNKAFKKIIEETLKIQGKI
ncbi:MAG: GTP-binding protein [Candidatus Hermodarchaeota archaeon]